MSIVNGDNGMERKNTGFRDLDDLSAWLVNDDEIEKFYALDPALMDDIHRQRSSDTRIGTILCFGFLQRNHRAPTPDHPPPSLLVKVIVDQLGLHGDEPGFDYSAFCQDRRRYRRRLHLCKERLGLRNALSGDIERLEVRLNGIAEGLPASDELIRAALDHFRSERLMIPGSQTIVKIAGTAARRGKARLFGKVSAAASHQTMDRLEAALVATDKRTCLWADLSAPPLAPSIRNLLQVLDNLDWLKALEISDPGDETWKRLADLALKMPVDHIKAASEPRRRGLLAAGALRLRQRHCDAALSMFDRLLTFYLRGAHKTMQARALEQNSAGRRAIQTLIKATRLVLQAHNDKLDPFKLLDGEIGIEPLAVCLQQADTFVSPGTFDYRSILVERHGSIMRFAKRLIRSFAFCGDTAMQPLLAAVNEIAGERGGSIPDTLPEFVPKPWRALIMQDGAVIKRAWEVFLIVELRDRLRSGDVWIEDGERFRQFDSYLITEDIPNVSPTPVCPSLVGEAGLETYLAERRSRLAAGLSRFSLLAGNNELPDARLVNGQISISPIRAENTGNDPQCSLVQSMMPGVRITELLREVDRWTGFSLAFTDQRHGGVPKHPELLLSAILADGINLGLSKMASACKSTSLRQLRHVQTWCIREDTYKRALGIVVEAHRRLALAELWGQGTTSSSDGQYFPAANGAGKVSDINARYGAEPGVRFYTHISDQYGPFSSRAISATEGEAPHVLDGLLRHETGLTIEEHYVDTGGSSDHVFALCPFFGIRFAPRLRDIKDRRLYVFADTDIPSTISSIVGGRIDEQILRECWCDINRLAASIGSGKARAAVLLKKLAGYPRQNRLARALKELGRIERSIFMLDWFTDAALRKRTLAGLNKGEARNALARAVFFNRHGELRDRRYENQAYRASGLNLVVAAIIHWNTVYLQRVLDEVARLGMAIPERHIKQLSPLGWEHINLTGDYVWESADLPPPGQFRPLQNRSIDIAA